MRDEVRNLVADVSDDSWMEAMDILHARDLKEDLEKAADFDHAPTQANSVSQGASVSEALWWRDAASFRPFAESMAVDLMHHKKCSDAATALNLVGAGYVRAMKHFQECDDRSFEIGSLKETPQSS